MARHYRPYMEKGADRLSDCMRKSIEDGLRISAVDYLTALDWQKSLASGLDALFDKYDAIVTPAAPGEAPSIDTTGNPIFNALWTLCGVPAITLPLLQGANGLPVGVQVVGRRGDDARLLRTARWLARTLHLLRPARRIRRGRTRHDRNSPSSFPQSRRLALASFAVSVGVIIWFVPAPGLVVVTLLAVAGAAYDFFLTTSGRAQRVDKRNR